MKFSPLVILTFLASTCLGAADDAVDATSLRGKVLCGYQAWFRCPGDAMNKGWIHWSRDGRRIVPETLTFEMWPDVSEFPEKERYAAPGFTDAEGKHSYLFSSDDAATVRRHFEWMRTYGIDGAWLQHFVVDLPGGPAESRYESRMRTLGHVRSAARETGRAWALAYDVSGMPTDRIYETLTRDWKKFVDDGVAADPRYIREGGKPAVEVWGFYYKNQGNAMTPELGNKIIDFFKAPGPYQAFVVGGGDWDWRRNPDPEWRKMYRHFDAYSPWNVGNISKDRAGDAHAATSYWAEDKAECEKAGMLWLPVVYSGFSWDNLQQLPPGTSLIPRLGGEFFWKQFHAAANLGLDMAYVAMFDEVDEGTAIFKVSNTPPTQGHFVTNDDLPSDWYLRLTAEGSKILSGERPNTPTLPLSP